jgi:hypothetical protein
MAGKKQWSLKMPSPILTMAPLYYEARGIKLAMVSLDDRQVAFFKGQSLVHVIRGDDAATGLWYALCNGV